MLADIERVFQVAQKHFAALLIPRDRFLDDVNVGVYFLFFFRHSSLDEGREIAVDGPTAVFEEARLGFGPVGLVPVRLGHFGQETGLGLRVQCALALGCAFDVMRRLWSGHLWTWRAPRGSPLPGVVAPCIACRPHPDPPPRRIHRTAGPPPRRAGSFGFARPA